MNREKLEHLYALALRFYPARFRGAYAPAMRQSFRDALEDRTLARHTLIAVVIRDLVTSLFKEHFAMLYETFARPSLIYNALVLTGLSTGLAMALNTIPQQVLRQGANDPQIAMATDAVDLLERGDMVKMLQHGASPLVIDGGANIDMAKSLSPFVIVYNDRGQPLASKAMLNGQTPAPPMGVFDYVRQHGEERFSWQPILGREHGVRIAAVMERVNGSQPGFVLAGRNMREVEAREALVGQLALLTWIGMMGVILLGTAVYGWWTRPKAE
jgi:hypothetical protein